MPSYNNCRLLEFMVYPITHTCRLCTSLLVYLLHVFGPSGCENHKWFPDV